MLPVIGLTRRVQGRFKMKKIATLASAIALAVTSLSAGAWWGGPCTPCGMTQEQQQAMAQQQTKAREQMMAAQRRLAEQMAARQAEMAKHMQTQGVDPTTMGFPGGDPWGTANPWDDMAMPEYPTMPAMPEPPSMPAIPEPFSMDMPQPPIPGFMRDRYAELEAYRSKMVEESKARRDRTTKEIAERRRKIEANRLTRPHRYSRPPFRSPYTRMTTTPEIPASMSQTAPAVKVPAQVSGTAPAPEATPTPATATDQAPVPPAVPATPVPAPETTPVAPAPAAATPQN